MIDPRNNKTITDWHPETGEPCGWVDQPGTGREFWIMFDDQTGRWCVEEAPMKVVRPGCEVIHVREVLHSTS